MLATLLLTALIGATSPAPATALAAQNLQALGDYNRAQDGQTLIVMVDGKVLTERYDNGGSADRLQMLASGSKSFVATAFTAAVHDGLLQFDERVADTLTEWKSDPLKSLITYRQLLSLTSGLKGSERGSALRGPPWKEIPSRPMTGRPGEQYEYGALQLDTAAYALEQKLGGESFEHYLQRRVFAPLGVTVEWRFKCADGHPQVAAGAFMTARDWAKFGEMIRLGGQYDGRRMLDSAALAQCFTGSAPNPAYGMAWWLKQPVSAEQISKIPLLSRTTWAMVANVDWIPGDLVAARGGGNQRLYIIPSKKLVAVRQARLNRTYSDLEFLSLLLRGKSAQ